MNLWRCFSFENCFTPLFVEHLVSGMKYNPIKRVPEGITRALNVKRHFESLGILTLYDSFLTWMIVTLAFEVCYRHYKMNKNLWIFQQYLIQNRMALLLDLERVVRYRLVCGNICIVECFCHKPTIPHWNSCWTSLQNSNLEGQVVIVYYGIFIEKATFFYRRFLRFRDDLL